MNIHQPGIYEIVLDLKVGVASSLDWTVRFIELGGFELLFGTLSKLQKDKKAKYLDLEMSIFRVIRHLLISEGSERRLTLLKNTKNKDVIVNLMDHPMMLAHTCFSEMLLSIVTLGKEGLNVVMGTFCRIKEKKYEPRPFCTFIALLRDVIKGLGIMGSSVHANKKIIEQQEDVIEFVTTCIALLRYMVECTPDMLSRIHLRNMFNSCGLPSIFETLKNFSMDFKDVFKHIESYESAARIELCEFSDNMIEFAGFTSQDTDLSLKFIRENLNDDISSWESIVSILQSFAIAIKIHDISYR
ncbi:hypothetical protein HK096_000338 [Nowakowskiella sp. JEL0078]|nr:hypothetical protein HK096_000338 [Nowakowskiella sp. JEL0078]